MFVSIQVILSEFCVSAIAHDLLLSKSTEQKQSPPGNIIYLIFFQEVNASVLIEQITDTEYKN